MRMNRFVNLRTEQRGVFEKTIKKRRGYQTPFTFGNWDQLQREGYWTLSSVLRVREGEKLEKGMFGYRRGRFGAHPKGATFTIDV